MDPLKKFYRELNPRDPVDRVILHQLRGVNLEAFQDAVRSKYPPIYGFESKLVNAIDLKYHRNALDEEREKELLEWWSLGMRQQDLANMLKVHQSTISRWLHKIKGDN